MNIRNGILLSLTVLALNSCASVATAYLSEPIEVDQIKFRVIQVQTDLGIFEINKNAQQYYRPGAGNVIATVAIRTSDGQSKRFADVEKIQLKSGEKLFPPALFRYYPWGDDAFKEAARVFSGYYGHSILGPIPNGTKEFSDNGIYTVVLGYVVPKDTSIDAVVYGNKTINLAYGENSKPNFEEIKDVQ